MQFRIQCIWIGSRSFLVVILKCQTENRELSNTMTLGPLFVPFFLHYLQEQKRNIELIARFLLEPLAFFKDPTQTTPINPPHKPSLIPNPPKAFFIPDACIVLGLLGWSWSRPFYSETKTWNDPQKKLGPSNPSTPEITIAYIMTLPFSTFDKDGQNSSPAGPCANMW